MGLKKLGVNVKLDARLLRECESQGEDNLVPSSLLSELHQGILNVMPLESLTLLRIRIFQDAREAFSLTRFIRYPPPLTIQRAEIRENIRQTEKTLSTGPRQTDRQEAVRYALNLLTKLIHTFRDHVSRQEVCQLVSINESTPCNHPASFSTLAIRTSLHSGQSPHPIDLEIDRHTWTMSFNLFQNEALQQLESSSFCAFFYSFSLEPLDGSGAETDLYLCMRVEKMSEAGKLSGIYAPADIDPDRIQDDIVAMGFPFE
jgi:hypothetical protein